MAVNSPTFPPKQLTIVGVPMAATRTAGWVMVTVSVSVQPFASVTVTVYVPAAKLQAPAVVAPVDQA